MHFSVSKFGVPLFCYFLLPLSLSLFHVRRTLQCIVYDSVLCIILAPLYCWAAVVIDWPFATPGLRLAG